MKIIVNHGSSLFFRKPRSKKKRIINKWKKQSCNWKHFKPDDNCYIMNEDTIICNPYAAALLNIVKKSFENETMPSYG